MKKKISVSINEQILADVDGLLNDCHFRNKSHVVEVALNKLINEGKNEL